jgi:signal transduction histidine kinase
VSGPPAVPISAAGYAGSAQRMRRGYSRLFLWAVSLAWMAIMIGTVISEGASVLGNPLVLLAWALLVAVIHLLPVPGWLATDMSTDYPVTIAAAFILSPIECGLIGFLGAIDKREFQGQITPLKSLFNRSQIGLSYLLLSLLAHDLAPSPSSSGLILPLAFVLLATNLLINYALVGVAISLEHGYGLSDVIRKLRLGTFGDFVMAFIAWAVLGAMLVALYEQVHLWALLAFLAPVLLGRQVLSRSQDFLDTARAYRSRERAIAEISKKISEERSDERKLIAANLHDEVLQPLYKVSLMAHVIRAELASGRLLEVDDDLPELLTAAELASRILREVIGDLRRSTLGRGGVSSAITSLARGLANQTPIRVKSRINHVTTDAARELVLYQVAKEALNNAVAHSGAENVSIELVQGPSGITLTVRDNGIGFEPLQEQRGHYGVQIMRERAASVGCQLVLQSSPGEGSSVTMTCPKRPD